MSDSANLMIKDRSKSWWAQTKPQSTAQRGFWWKRASLAHWTVMTWTVQGNQRWSQGLTTMEEYLLRLQMGPGVAPCCRDGQPHSASPWNTIAAVFCITGNCNIKSVGLWMGVHVFFGTCGLGTHDGQETGKPLWQFWISSHRTSSILRCSPKNYCLHVSVIELKWISQRAHLGAKDVGAGGSRLAQGNLSHKLNQ